MRAVAAQIWCLSVVLLFLTPAAAAAAMEPGPGALADPDPHGHHAEAAQHPQATASLTIGGNFLIGGLDAALADLDPAGVLEPFFEKESVAFHHVRLHQLVDGIRVLDAGASEHVAKRDADLRIAHVQLVPAGTPTVETFDIGTEDAIEAAEAELGVRMAFPDLPPTVEPVWSQAGDHLRAAYAVELSALDPAGSWRVVVDASDGTILAQHALTQVFDDAHEHESHALTAPDLARLLYGAPLDILADGRTGADAIAYQATVHRVNPIVALQDAAFRDNIAGIDDGSFADALMQVSIPVFEGMPLMTGDVWVVDALTVPAAGDDLHFRRDDPRFLELMIVYYVEHARDLLAEHGYDDVLPYEQVRAVARVPSPLPNAMAARPGGQGYIVFFYRSPTTPGPGFASSAEDAEVVVHELGHLYHHGAAPGTGGPWYSAWAEGSADFFAAILLEGENLSKGFGDPCMGEWFTTYLTSGEPDYEDLLCIRVLENELVYPEDLRGTPENPGSGHYNGQFWSGPNWEIRKEIGQNESIRLFMEALYLTPQEINNLTDLADTVLFADCGLTECDREPVIRGAFEAKNLTVADIPEEFRKDNETETLEPSEEEVAVPAPTVLLFVAVLGVLVTRLRLVRRR